MSGKMNNIKIKRLYAVIICSIIFSLISLSISIFLFLDRSRIAYVYNNRILTEYIGIKEAKKTFDNKVKIMQSNLDNLSIELDRNYKFFIVISQI